MINNEEHYKACTLCGYEWQTLQSFVQDCNLTVNGYQACFEKAEEGLFLLTHVCPQCHSTLAVRASDFTHWDTGSRPGLLNMGKETCPGRCLNNDDLEPCTAECSMRWVRDVLQYLKAHHVPSESDS